MGSGPSGQSADKNTQPTRKASKESLVQCKSEFQTSNELPAYFLTPRDHTESFLNKIGLGFVRSSANELDDRRRQRCLKAALNEDMMLKMLLSALETAGCPFEPSRHLRMLELGEKAKSHSSFYDPAHQQVIINTAESGVRGQPLILTLAHELVHLLDQCRAETDFSDLRHLACTEIRAANLLGCAPSTALIGGGSTGAVKPSHHQNSHANCVRTQALREMEAVRPGVEREKLIKVIEAVFPQCYGDLEPFGRRLRPAETDSLHPKLAYYQRKNYGYY